MDFESVDKAQLLEVVMDHYGLAYPGRDKKVCCFVHDEDRPSCSITVSTGLWYCHACGAGGDGFKIIQHKEGVTAVESLRIAQEILDGSGREIQLSASRQRGRGVSGKTGDRSSRRKYVPSWSRP